MIPRTIHYCWFGRNQKPKLAVRCMKSWKKYCRDFALIEWNEDNFDIEKAPLYVRQAYEAKKWAFVTDYVRLYALFYYGGIYMDTDVEVLKALEEFLHLKGFSGFEDESLVPTGIMASQKEHHLIKEWLAEYESKQFILQDGSRNTETNVVAITRSMEKHGLRLDNSLQTVEDFTFYPKDYFCPKSYYDGKIYKTGNTYTIHHFAGSWLSDEERKMDKERIAYLHRDKYLRPIKTALQSVIGESKYKKMKEVIKGR